MLIRDVEERKRRDASDACGMRVSFSPSGWPTIRAKLITSTRGEKKVRYTYRPFFLLLCGPLYRFDRAFGEILLIDCGVKAILVPPNYCARAYRKPTEMKLLSEFSRSRADNGRKIFRETCAATARALLPNAPRYFSTSDFLPTLLRRRLLRRLHPLLGLVVA